MTKDSLKNLKDSIQLNCHISDAQYAGNYTLCIYLLKMREFYRWEKSIPYSQKLSNDDIGDWLTKREAHWDEIDELSFENLFPEPDKSIDCFDADSINTSLAEHNLVYSAGFGHYGKPVFVLADLESKTQVDEYSLTICGHEHIRELAAPPGMSHGKHIFIRKESLKRFIWEKVEESRWYSKDNPLARALGYYDFENNIEQSLEQMTSLETDTVLHHEIGEVRASQLLGESWNDMVMQMPRSQAEFMARAIKDHLADAISTLPRLIENNDPAQIHFYFANLSGMRREIFPALMDSYLQWKEKADNGILQNVAAQSLQHWQNIAENLLDMFTETGLNGLRDLENMVKRNYLEAIV